MKSVGVERQDILASLESLVEEKHNGLNSVDKSWQPADFLPNLACESGRTALIELQKSARELPDEVLVVLVGSTITEEALPSYQSCLTRTACIGDETGISLNGWARWSRSWTAEENRHGDLLNRYLYLTGRVNMQAVEKTIQHLIRNGFDPGHENDPYNLLIYTSFQEQATRISHANVGQLAKQSGVLDLARICNAVAADEARHEDAYKSFMRRIFNLDPAGAILAFDEMLTKKIKMPAALMSDGSSVDVFSCFAGVAQELGVYTFTHYMGIIRQLIKIWDVEHLKGLSGPAAQAQDRICILPDTYQRRIAWLATKPKQRTKPPFPWICSSIEQIKATA